MSTGLFTLGCTLQCLALLVLVSVRFLYLSIKVHFILAREILGVEGDLARAVGLQMGQLKERFSGDGIGCCGGTGGCGGGGGGGDGDPHAEVDGGECYLKSLTM